jgi:hypothetical protein
LSCMAVQVESLHDRLIRCLHSAPHLYILWRCGDRLNACKILLLNGFDI